MNISGHCQTRFTINFCLTHFWRDLPKIYSNSKGQAEIRTLRVFAGPSKSADPADPPISGPHPIQTALVTQPMSLHATTIYSATVNGCDENEKVWQHFLAPRLAKDLTVIKSWWVQIDLQTAKNCMLTLPEGT